MVRIDWRFKMNATLIFQSKESPPTWKATIIKESYSDSYDVILITNGSKFTFTTFFFCSAIKSINRKLKLLGFSDKIDHAWRM